MSERNHLLRATRERTPSRRLPNAAMSRQELAEAVNAWLHENKMRSGALDAHYVARLERGAVRWPNEEYRAGFRAILGVHDDVDLGFSPRKRAVQPALSDAQVTAGPMDMIEAWKLTDTLTRYSISNATLDHMERAVFGYATRYPSTPPRVLLPAVSGQMRRLSGALDRPQPLRVRQRAVVLLGMLSGLAGNLWLDLDQQDRATAFFDVGELAADPPSGTEFFDLPRLDGMAGSAYLLMADTDRAAPLLCQARGRRATHDAKGRALLTLDLAECHVVSRELEEAARLVVEALETAHGVLVGPILARTRLVLAGMDEWAGSKAVRDLDSRVAELIRG